MVSVFVGKDEKEYVIYKALLCDQVDFFASAFQGNFKEAHENRIFLPDEDPDAFSLFLVWLYKGLSFEKETIGSINEEAVVEYVKLYDMGDKWCCSLIRKAVTEVLFKWLEDRGDISRVAHAIVVKKLYAQPSSMMMRFLFFRHAVNLPFE